MKIHKFCKSIAGPCMLLVLGVVLGVAGTIENGGSLSLAWVGFAALAGLGIVLCLASREDDHD